MNDRDANGFFELPVVAMAAELAGTLDWDHSDPFDRLLVAQALRVPLVLVTADEAVRKHSSVLQLWACLAG